jgi:hypothetical protein
MDADSLVLHAAHALQGGFSAGLAVALFVIAMGGPAILILRPRRKGGGGRRPEPHHRSQSRHDGGLPEKP